MRDVSRHLDKLFAEHGEPTLIQHSRNPGTRGRTMWWDDDRGLIIIRQGDGGTVFRPDRGYQCFRDQLLE